MPFPLKLTCHQCSASLLIRKPARRGRCNHCGAIIDLESAIGEAAEPPIAAAPSEPAPKACAAVLEPPPATSCAVETIAPAGRSWRRRIVACLAIVFGGIAATCLYLYWPAQNSSPPSVVVVPVPHSPQTDVIADESEDGVILETPEETAPGTGLGQLDNLLLTAQAFSGSWLTGIGSASNDIHAPCPDPVINPIPFGTGITSSPAPVSSLVVDTPRWTQPGPLSDPPPEFGYEAIEIPNMQGVPLGIVKSNIEALGLVFVCIDQYANFDTDVVVAYTPDKAAYKSPVRITSVGRPVPDVLNLPISAATEVLIKDGFESRYDPTVSVHQIVSLQYPAAGTIAVRGSGIELASLTHMPMVEGLAIAEAIQILKNDDIYGTWWREDYDPSRWPGDVVCSQSIRSGQSVVRGAKYVRDNRVPTVKLWAGVRVPGIVGLTGDDAVTRLQQLGIEWRHKIDRVVVRTDKHYVGIEWRNRKNSADRTFLFAGSSGDSAIVTNPAQVSNRKQILAQFGGGATHDVFVRSEEQNDGHQQVIGQNPQAGQILCRGKTLDVRVRQPMVRIEYYRRVPNQNNGQGGGGMGGGGGGGVF